jgi:hypothetical protein
MPAAFELIGIPVSYSINCCFHAGPQSRRFSLHRKIIHLQQKSFEFSLQAAAWLKQAKA